MNVFLSQFHLRCLSAMGLLLGLSLAYITLPLGGIVFVSVAFLGAAYELYSLMRRHLFLCDQGLVLGLTGLACINPIIALGLLGVSIILLRLYQSSYYKSVHNPGPVILIFATLWTVLALSASYGLAVILKQQFIDLLFVLAIGVSVDSLGYFIGKGSHAASLGWRISPKKTQIGYIGAIIGTFGLFTCNTTLSHHSNFILLGLILFSIWGDLVFSLPKRLYQLKDYSHILPGHGGCLDRLDSLCGILFFMQILYYFDTGCFLFPEIL